MAAALSTLSASVTRILSLTGFPKELKTKDIQSAFSEYDGTNGGFKIKWIDDTSLYIVFSDPSVAKRAYLRTIAFPPPIFTSPTHDVLTTIRPYDGPDAQTVIQAIHSRSTPAAAAGSRRAASVSIPGPPRRGSHAPHASVAGGEREPSPTLPSLPTHPTLEALIDAAANTAPPRIGDPGKRMLGHALGVRHPSLGGRTPAGESVARAMGGLTIAE